jgi:uncharacterized protein (DUF2252 family)
MSLSGRAERIAHGKQQRRSCPRSSHAAWPSLMNRPSPLDLLAESQASRRPDLEAVRWGRMIASPFAFLRGSAMVMAWDVAHLPHGEVYVQACGDAHLCNFGVWATPERRLIFDLRDFDETLPAPWEWDVKRLAASVAVAARQLGLSRQSYKEAVLGCVRSYREVMRATLDMTHLDVWYRRVDAESIAARVEPEALRFVEKTLTKARRRTSARAVEKLTVWVDGERRIREERPLIFPVEDPKFRDGMNELMKEYAATLSPDPRVLFDRYQLVDFAFRVVGVGSVGTRCMVALFYGDGPDDPLFLQIKEAGRSVLEPYVRPCGYANQGERVVQGQRILQAASDLFLGWKSTGSHDYYVRQLADMKGTLDLEAMPPASMAAFAALCGRTLAHAHARSGDFCQIAGYLGTSDSFDVAIGEFASTYADQVERDHALLLRAVRAGRLPAELGA